MTPESLRRLADAAGVAFTRDRVRLASVKVRQAQLVNAGEEETEEERREITAAAADPASAMTLAAYRAAADARRRARAKAAAALEAEAAEAIAVASASFRKTQAVAFLEQRARAAARRAAAKREEDALDQLVALRSASDLTRRGRKGSREPWPPQDGLSDDKTL